MTYKRRIERDRRGRDREEQIERKRQRGEAERKYSGDETERRYCSA